MADKGGRLWELDRCLMSSAQSHMRVLIEHAGPSFFFSFLVEYNDSGRHPYPQQNRQKYDQEDRRREGAQKKRWNQWSRAVFLFVGQLASVVVEQAASQL
jgi:hypothetical protein